MVPVTNLVLIENALCGNPEKGVLTKTATTATARLAGHLNSRRKTPSREEGPSAGGQYPQQSPVAGGVVRFFPRGRLCGGVATFGLGYFVMGMTVRWPSME